MQTMFVVRPSTTKGTASKEGDVSAWRTHSQAWGNAQRVARSDIEVKGRCLRGRWRHISKAVNASCVFLNISMESMDS